MLAVLQSWLAKGELAWTYLSVGAKGERSSWVVGCSHRPVYGFPWTLGSCVPANTDERNDLGLRGGSSAEHVQGCHAVTWLTHSAACEILGLESKSYAESRLLALLLFELVATISRRIRSRQGPSAADFLVWAKAKSNSKLILEADLTTGASSVSKTSWQQHPRQLRAILTCRYPISTGVSIGEDLCHGVQAFTRMLKMHLSFSF
jgi:hypothetical protein